MGRGHCLLGWAYGGIRWGWASWAGGLGYSGSQELVVMAPASTVEGLSWLRPGDMQGVMGWVFLPLSLLWANFMGRTRGRALNNPRWIVPLMAGGPGRG